MTQRCPRPSAQRQQLRGVSKDHPHAKQLQSDATCIASITGCHPQCHPGQGTFRYNVGGSPNPYWFMFTVSNTRCAAGLAQMPLMAARKARGPGCAPVYTLLSQQRGLLHLNPEDLPPMQLLTATRVPARQGPGAACGVRAGRVLVRLPPVRSWCVDSCDTAW